MGLDSADTNDVIRGDKEYLLLVHLVFTRFSISLLSLLFRTARPVVPPNFKPSDAGYRPQAKSLSFSPLAFTYTNRSTDLVFTHSDVAMVQSGDALVATTV